jgi:4-hydroxy-4-methyl-2-oxoglutarate aldolase
VYWSLRTASKKKATVSGSVLKFLARAGTATVCDATVKPRALSRKIRPVFRCGGLAGQAITAMTRGGSTSVVQAAIAFAKPGDVLVLKSAGKIDAAIFGGILATAACRRRIAGVVVDGLIRDVDEIENLGLPVFARGIFPFATHRKISGSLNGTLTCGRVKVHPGDIVIADSDGIVIVNHSTVPDLIRTARKVKRAEAIRLRGLHEDQKQTHKRNHSTKR